MKKYPVKALEKGDENLEEKEYMGNLIKIKISVKDDFTSSFLKLPGCILIDVRVCQNVSLVLKLKRKVHLNFSYKSVILTVRPTCHMIKCEKSIQRQKKILLL